MDIKKISRLRRAKRSRIKMRELGAIRLTVFRTSRHTYAQVLNSSGDQVLAQASTLEESIRRTALGIMSMAANKHKYIRAALCYNRLADWWRKGRKRRELSK